MHPSLYVVTVNYHSTEQIRALIASLEPVGFVRKLIIVDHSNSQSLDDLGAEVPIVVIRQANRGYGAGLNTGLREIEDPDAVAFLCNPDIRLVSPDRLSEALSFMGEHPGVGCLVPSLVNKFDQPVPSCRHFFTVKTLLASRFPGWRENPPDFLKEHFYLNRHVQEPYEVDWGSGSALLVRRDMFPDRASFDERFFLYFEDVDFCAQVWRAGLSVVFYPGLICRHEEQARSRREARFFATLMASLFRYAWKYRGLPQRDVLVGLNRA